MKNISDFKTHHREEIVPKLAPLEERRLFALRKKQWLFFIVFILLALHAVLILYRLLPLESIVISVIVLPLGAAYIFTKRYDDVFLFRDWRALLAHETLAYLLESTQSKENQFVSYEEFKNSQLFLHEAEHYLGNALGLGKLAGQPVKFSVLEAGYLPTGQQDWAYTFRGIFMVIETKTDWINSFQVLPSDLEKNFGVFGEKIKRKNFHRGYGIKVANEDFSQYFVAYSDSRTAGKDFLDTDLAQAIVDFYRQTNLEVYLSFRNQKIYLAIEIPQSQNFSFLQSLLKPAWAEKVFKPLRNLLIALGNKIENA